MAKTPPKIDIATHPEFRVIHVNGVFGGLRPDEGYIKFYLNILLNKQSKPVKCR